MGWEWKFAHKNSRTDKIKTGNGNFLFYCLRVAYSVNKLIIVKKGYFCKEASHQEVSAICLYECI